MWEPTQDKGYFTKASFCRLIWGADSVFGDKSGFPLPGTHKQSTAFPWGNVCLVFRQIGAENSFLYLVIPNCL